MISIASSIKFRKQDGQLSSFDNVLHNDIARRGAFIHRYNQKVYATDTVTIQAKVTNGYTVLFYYSEDAWKAWTAMAAATLEVDGADYDYYQIDIDFSAYNFPVIQFKMEIYNGDTLTETWISEPVEILSETDDNLLQVEFFNIDNAFDVDYTTGIAHLLRVEGQMSEYKPAGEATVFDNQQEVTKIRDEVKRILTFKTEAIPWYLAEMLIVACAHDKFFVNEVEFVAEDKPSWEGNASNVGVLTMSLTQRSVIGLNTHDVGFDCDAITDSDMIHLREDDASGQVSFTVPEGYLIAYMTAYRTAGDPVITAGTTPGGTNVVANVTLNGTTKVWTTSHIGREIAPAGDATLYVTVSGAGATADIDILLINNRQTA